MLGPSALSYKVTIHVNTVVMGWQVRYVRKEPAGRRRYGIDASSFIVRTVCVRWCVRENAANRRGNVGARLRFSAAEEKSRG
jgi:hypothetical protein